MTELNLQCEYSRAGMKRGRIIVERRGQNAFFFRRPPSVVCSLQSAFEIEAAPDDRNAAAQILLGSSLGCKMSAQRFGLGDDLKTWPGCCMRVDLLFCLGRVSLCISWQNCFDNSHFSYKRIHIPSFPPLRSRIENCEICIAVLVHTAAKKMQEL